MQNSWTSDLQASILATLDQQLLLPSDSIITRPDAEVGKTLLRPGNILEWATVPGFQYEDPEATPLYPSQYVILRDFYELLCPFCNDVLAKFQKWDNNAGLEQFAGEVYLKNNKCPKCHVTRKDISDQGKYQGYSELVGASGARSGKTDIACIIGNYQTMSILSMPEPWRLYGLRPKSRVEIVFVAASGRQATDTIWESFKTFFGISPWMQAYVKEVQALEDNPDLSYGKESLYRPTGDKIIFENKRLQLIALHTNSASLSGRTRVGVFIDELAKLNLTNSKISANEVYRTLKQGLMTIRMYVKEQRRQGNFDLPDALQVEISSPLSAHDKISELKETAKTKKRLFAFSKASWELNPNLKYEDLAEEYSDDPWGLQRDFGAEPTDPDLAFKPGLVDKGIGAQDPIVYVQDNFFTEVNPKTGEETFYIAPKLLNCINDKVTERILVADAGHVGDSFGIALAHKAIENNNVVYIYDAVLECRPMPKAQNAPAHEVYFPGIEALILALAAKLNIVLISLDRWQQIHIMQNLKHQGLSVVNRNVSSQDYRDFRVDLHAGGVRMLASETKQGDQRGRGLPQAKALVELKNMREMGDKIVKGSASSDDLCQCVVGCHHHLRERALGLSAGSKHPGRSLREFSGRTVHVRR